MTHAFLVNLCLAIGAGTMLVVLARRLNLPSIVVLLLGGIALGPEGLGVIDPAAFGGALPALVSFAVGVILFEGGLTLDLRGFTQASGVIRRLLTIGVLITWLGTGVAIFVVYGYDVRFCLFAASLVIVTGPTVILPLLRRIHVQPRVNGILHWEGVLIDAIGVFIAILCFEWLVAGEGSTALFRFGIRVVAGLAIGLAGGLLIDLFLRKRVVPESLVNAFALAAAVLIFGLTEVVMPEAGLLSVTLAGLVVGWRHPVELKQIKQFKAELTDLLIGTLFIVLAGRLELARFVEFGKSGLVLVVLVMFVVRPLNVLASTWGSALSWRERVFLSWVAPRGIVAASMASLFALDLAKRRSDFDGEFVEIFVYSVIASTVVLQGFSAGLVARLLGLRRPEATGWLFVGAHRLGCEIVKFLQRTAKIEATIVDTNPRLVAEAAADGLPAIHADALDVEVIGDSERFQRIGRLVAFTDNVELNEIACQRWRDRIEREWLFRWGVAKPAGSNPAQPVVGSVVWDKLLRPGLLSAELRRGEASMLEVSYAGSGALPDAQVVAVARKNHVILDPFSRASFAPRAGDTFLLIQRAAAFLVRGLANGGMVDLEPGLLGDIHRQLAQHAVDFEPKIDTGALLLDLAERERLMPTFLGRGVAAPHAFIRGLGRRIVILGRLREGLAAQGQDEPVRLFFLIVSAPGDSEGHLATLADIARLCVQTEARNQLLVANDREEMLAVVRSVLE